MAPEAPYKGLVPFTLDDAGLFFGRDADCDLVIANLMAARFTVVYGSSGVGKSSLLRAGVQHRLRAVARENLRTSGTPQLAVVVFSAWQDDPLARLVHEIHMAVADAWLSESIRPTNGALDDHLDHALRRAAESVDGELVVILDQFEDYLQNHPGDEATTQFAIELARAVASEAVHASFLVSIREDMLAKLDSFEGQIPNLFSNLLRIEPLDRESARLAIESPIDQYNRHNAPPAAVEPALVEAVLDQVRTGRLTMGDPERLPRSSHADERERIEAPYLQLVMKRLWESTIARDSDGPIELQLTKLQQLGGAEHIVHTHLDATMDGLPSRERRIAARIFGYLVTPSGARIAHSAADLCAYADVGPPELEPVLANLCAARILQPIAPHSGRRATTRYEIFHDLLAPAILDWRQRFLRDTERDLAGRQLAIERRRVWYLRRRVVSLSVLLLGIVIVAIVALFATDARQVVLSREASQRLESIFLACFAFGALFTLFSALLGVHGLGHAGHPGSGHHLAAPSHGGGWLSRQLRAPLANSSSMLAFLTWFGAAGYVLERYAEWVLGAVLLGAVAAGAVGWLAINRFIDLILKGEREMDPEEYRLEGTIGRITVAIPAGGAGEVVFTKGGVRRSEAAHAATGALPRGTEVVITSYDGGFATVEPWSALLDER